jgi:glycosyltransferase involved in cell wall biosynthesis
MIVMRIALNLHGFSPGRGGVETYLKNLLEALPLVDRDNKYLVLCDRLGEKWLETVSGDFVTQVVPYDRPGLRWLVRGVLQRTCGYDLLLKSLRGLSVDVVHHPLTVLNPRGLPFPAVLTFHDLQQEYYPEFFSAEELRKRRDSYLLSVQEARSIIAVSEHAKRGLVERYGIPEKKVHVVYHGFADCFGRISEPFELDETTRRYDLQRPFMIYPAATWSHKNHLRLLSVVRRLVDQGRFDGELLLTGASMTAHDQVLTEISRLDLEKSVRWLGYLPYEDLPRMYNLARLMVFPSLFEGFGLPVLEAMACGCPVACSNVTSLPEVAGDAAQLFDPESEDEMLEVIEGLWLSEGALEVLSQKGQKQAASFSWEKAARQTIEVYRGATS